MSEQMSRYLATIAVTVCGVATFVGLVASQFGALATPATLADVQAKEPTRVVLPLGIPNYAEFKLRRAAQERPDVVWFSTSRAGTINDGMFKPYKFYNMAFTAWTTKQLADIFDHTTRIIHPRVAILSLDYFLFTDRWESNMAVHDMVYRCPFGYLKASFGDFIRKMAVQPLPLIDAYLRSPMPFLGTNSILQHEGFRSDGSYSHSPFYLEAARNFHTVPYLINNMPGAPRMSERQKQALVRLAELARQRDIILVAVQLPFIRIGIDYLDRDEAYHGLSGVWREFASRSNKAWLSELGITFFDLAESQIDDDEANFIDAYHPSEAGMLKVMEELSQRVEFRALFPNLKPTSGFPTLNPASESNSLEYRFRSMTLAGQMVCSIFLFGFIGGMAWLMISLSRFYRRDSSRAAPAR